MNLKIRLAGMMILLLMAVMAVQYFLAERQQRELISRLSELTQGVEQTTMELSRRANLVSRTGGSFDSLFVVLEAGSPESHDHDVTKIIKHVEDSGHWLTADGLYVESEVNAFLIEHRGAADGDTADSLSPLPRTRRGLTRTGTVELLPGRLSGGVLRDSCLTENMVQIRSLHDGRFELQSYWTNDSNATIEDLSVMFPIPQGTGEDGFLLRMSYPLDSITEELDASRKRGYLWLSMLLGVGVLGATLMAVQFTRPITSLQRSFRKVEQGELDVRLNPSRSDEIGELTLSFNEMVERLDKTRSIETRLAEAERMATIGSMAAGVAHEVRNPLNAILLNLEQMRDKVAAAGAMKNQEEFDRYLKNVTGEVTRLERMVTSFLDLSSTQELSRESLDLDQSIASSVQLFRPEAEAKGVSLNFSPGECGVISADKARLATVWNNLLSNAIEATPEGGSIRVSSVAGDAGVIRIEDTGPGIGRENLAKIWEPFFTGNAAGTGLGLSIVRSVVEAHDGSVEAESTLGEGTVIQVTLPIKETGSSAQTH